MRSRPPGRHEQAKRHRRRKNHYVRIRDRLAFWARRREIRHDARRKRTLREEEHAT